MEIETIHLDPKTDYLGYGLEYVKVTLEDGQVFHLAEPVPGRLRILLRSRGYLVVEPSTVDSIYVRSSSE